jgi:hypothetical protein
MRLAYPPRVPLLDAFARSWVCVLGLVGLVASGSASAADPYTEAFVRAEALAAEGRFAEGAAAVEAALGSFPQDYALTLEAAWLRYQSGEYARAEVHYRRAIRLSEGAWEARLGLGWSLLLQGERGEAEGIFEGLAAEAPGDARAAEGLRAAQARVAVIAAPRAALTGQIYPDAGGMTGALGVSVGAPLVIKERVLVGVDYSFARFQGVGAAARAGGMHMNMGGFGPGSPVGRGDFIDRHAIYAHAGATWERVGFTTHYGYIRDGGRLIGDAHVAGAALRYSPLGDLSLAIAAGFWPDQAIPRASLAWAAPATRWLTITPAAAVQVADGAALGSGSLGAAVHGRPGALWVGGKVGPERRPIYLHVPETFSVDGEIRWGLWAGGRAELPGHFNLFAGWELHRLAGVGPGAVVTSAHILAIGVGWRSHAPPQRGRPREER